MSSSASPQPGSSVLQMSFRNYESCAEGSGGMDVGGGGLSQQKLEEQELDRCTPLLDAVESALDPDSTNEEERHAGKFNLPLGSTARPANASRLHLDASTASLAQPVPTPTGRRSRLLPSAHSSSSSLCSSNPASRQGSRLVVRHARRRGQAKGSRWNVVRVGKGEKLPESVGSLLTDSFNTLLMAPTAYTLAFLASAYLFLVVLFAGIYLLLALEEECNMDIDSFLKGYLFSLETMVGREG
ncbi:hypothetical protein Naga_100389g4, partial [Nannochloropsis gaditana]